MGAPDVVLDVHRHADDAGRLGLGRLGLHPGQGQLAGLVDALGELHHLLVLVGLAQALHHGLVGDVIDAGAEHEGDRHRAGREQPEEVLRGQVRGERAAVGRAVRAPSGQVADRGPGGHELQAVLAPGVHLHAQLDPDDAVGAQVVGLGPHPGHGQLPGVVHGLGQDLQLLVLVPAADLQADVVDRGADHEPERLESGLARSRSSWSGAGRPPTGCGPSGGPRRWSATWRLAGFERRLKAGTLEALPGIGATAAQVIAAAAAGQRPGYLVRLVGNQRLCRGRRHAGCAPR